MSQQQQQPPMKGRAGLLMKLLAQSKEKKPGAEQPQGGAGEQPLKPRGRAALLQKIAELQAAQQVGAPPGPSTEAAGPSKDTSPLKETPAPMKKEVKAEGAKETPKAEEGPRPEPYAYSGSTGKPMRIAANYIRLIANKDRGVYEYVVDFNPVVDAKNVRFKIVNMNIAKVGNIRLYDGGSILFLPLLLPEKVVEFVTPHPENPDVTVTMKLTFLRKKHPGDCVQLYNILFKRVMNALLYSGIGRAYFDEKGGILIPQYRLEVLPGYVISADEFQDGLMLCLDTQHRVLRTITVMDVLREYQKIHKERCKEVFGNHIIGTSVLTKYNNKTYVVHEIKWDLNPSCTFETYAGTHISYIEYYKKQYNIQINDLKQPLLLNRKAVRVPGSLEKQDRFFCLVPELCYMTGLTAEMLSDFRMMKEVAQHTRISPNQRMLALRKYLDNVRQSEQAQKILKDWGLQLDSACIDLQARLIDPETVIFGGGVAYRCNEKADFNNALCNNPLFGPVDFENWAVVHTHKDGWIAREFGEALKRMASVMGNIVRTPKLFSLDDDRTESYVNACRRLISPNMQLLVFICPTVRSDRYAAIKKMCCGQMPIASQVILSKTLMNQQRARAITQKIAYQMICKLGGSLWTVRFPFKQWMTVGIDIYHGKGMKSSVCAFVASMNDSMTSWYSQVVFQQKEIGDHLKTFFMRCMEKFRDTNGEFPNKVVVFRDGVGDGQLQQCHKYEVPQFEETLKDYNISDCGICYVIVQKRINTRMLVKAGDGQYDNPHPGSIIDHTITRRNLYDFYLVSQHVRQGTVSPTHYITLYDSAKIKPDHLQRLTFKMCHLYYNWPGTIRVPAPCQYAHKLAYLVGQSVGKEPSEQLSDRLYYL